MGLRAYIIHIVYINKFAHFTHPRVYAIALDGYLINPLFCPHAPPPPSTYSPDVSGNSECAEEQYIIMHIYTSARMCARAPFEIRPRRNGFSYKPTTTRKLGMKKKKRRAYRVFFPRFPAKLQHLHTIQRMYVYKNNARRKNIIRNKR